MDIKIKALSRPCRHHFFGYYGINPWDSSGRYHLALETDFHECRPGREDSAAVGLVDAESGEFLPYARTPAFNLQQGAMLHWIQAGFGEEFTFNYWDGKYLGSRAVHVKTKEVRSIDGAVAAVSPAGTAAMGLNYVRNFLCRNVTGYDVGQEEKDLEEVPGEDGLFRMDLVRGKKELVLPLTGIVRGNPAEETVRGPVWIDHVLFNTDGSRLLFLCRVKTKDSRRGFLDSLWTVNPDGSRLQCLIPFGCRVSHFAWFDADRLLVSTDRLGGKMQFVEITDQECRFTPFGGGFLPADGHACFSPDRRWLVCDTYPQGEEGQSELLLYHPGEGKRIGIGKFHSPPQFTGDIRCDLHPRWSADGTKISFDSVHEGTRQIYTADVAPVVG